MDDKILEAFEFGKIQECLNIKLKLNEYGISWEEFEYWVKDVSKRIQPTRQNRIPDIPKKRLERHCPDCDGWLNLQEVNNNPATMVGGDYKSHWYCLACEWEEYSVRDIVDEAKPFIKDMKVIYIPMSPRERKRERRLAEQEKCKGCEEK